MRALALINPAVFFSAALVSVHCFGTIVVPPVTITGQKTATERQIIGEQTELERDVWMISSAKTAEHAELEAKPKEVRQSMERENANTYRAFLKFEMFSGHLTQLKKDRVVGENNKGLVANLFNEKVEIPAEMREKGVEAKVILKIVVSENGLVTKVEVLRGEEPFVSAAIAAVKTWKYSPAMVGGEPTPVFRIVQLPFRLK